MFFPSCCEVLIVHTVPEIAGLEKHQPLNIWQFICISNEVWRSCHFISPTHLVKTHHNMVIKYIMYFACILYIYATLFQHIFDKTKSKPTVQLRLRLDYILIPKPTTHHTFCTCPTNNGIMGIWDMGFCCGSVHLCLYLIWHN